MKIDAYIFSCIMKVISVFLALACHQIAVAYMSYRLSDPNGKQYRRFSLNPLKHYDPLGAWLLVLSSIGTGSAFGWAEPIPFEAGRFKYNKRNTMLVGWSGPVSNVILAALAILALRLVEWNQLQILGYASWLSMFLSILAAVNISFAIFNLIPVPPLDGSKIFISLMPPKWQFYLTQYKNYGIAIVLVLAFFGIITPVLRVGTEFVIFVLDKTLSLLLGHGL